MSSDLTLSTQSTNLTLATQKAIGAAKATRAEARLSAVNDAILSAYQNPTVPLPFSKRRTLKERTEKHRIVSSAKNAEKSDESIKTEILVKIRKSAKEFEEENEELKEDALVLLRDQVGKAGSKKEIKEILEKFYKDRFLQDEALDFLLETTDGDLHKQLEEIKKQLHNEYEGEIRAGKNISEVARNFAKDTNKNPTELRELYRDITNNPRETIVLFEELASKFDYEKMKTAFDFIMHSLGADLKSKGPSIDSNELMRLMTEGKSLQAILTVYNFFKSRTQLINSQFAHYKLNLPSILTFEFLAKAFIKYIQDKYPSPDKLLKMAQLFQIDKKTMSQIIIFQQFRDGIRETSKRFYRSLRHQQDVLAAILEALEELEDLYEEELESSEEDEEDEK